MHLSFPCISKHPGMGLILFQQSQSAAQLAVAVVALGAPCIIFSMQVSPPVIPRLCTRTKGREIS